MRWTAATPRHMVDGGGARDPKLLEAGRRLESTARRQAVAARGCCGVWRRLYRRCHGAEDLLAAAAAAAAGGGVRLPAGARACGGLPRLKAEARRWTEAAVVPLHCCTAVLTQAVSATKIYYSGC
jgi:hypothetical protein